MLGRLYAKFILILNDGAVYRRNGVTGLGRKELGCGPLKLLALVLTYRASL